MNKISQSHRESFYALLSLISNTFSLDMENIHYIIEVKGRSSFPPRENSGIVLAVPKYIRDECLPLVPVVCVTSPPNHLSRTAGILELKIMDSRQAQDSKKHFIAWISVFPSGRMIFGMDGAHLDSSGKKVVVEKSVIIHDNKFWNDHKLIQTLRKAMVLAFQSQDEHALDGKREVLSALDSLLPANN